MVRTFYDTTVTRLRAEVVADRYGNEGPDWSGTVSELDIAGCRVQPLSSEEVMSNRFESDVRFRLLAPFGSDVTFLDRVQVGSAVYEVVGAPLSHQSPSGVAAHDEILLRAVSG